MEISASESQYDLASKKPVKSQWRYEISMYPDDWLERIVEMMMLTHRSRVVLIMACPLSGAKWQGIEYRFI